ncbi:branched-chain amino acid ABC transporter permease [Halobacteriaceae archaeon GCM10025711]
MAFALPGEVSFLVSIATVALIYGLLAIGLNVHYGYTGLLNFGHVAFFAAGAYTAAILTMPPPTAVEGQVGYAIGLGLPMPVGLPVSLAAAALAGGLLALLIGLTSVRLDTHYLAVATFALAGIFEDVLVNEDWLTRGVHGLNQVPRAGVSVLGPEAWQVAYLAFTALLTLGVYLVVERLVGSPFGRLLKGIREDERAARMLGKDTDRVKLTSFAVGGAIAGLAGAVYAHYVGSVVTGQFVSLVTFLVWVALLLGGAASNRGAVLGAFVLVAFREGTRFLPEIEGHPSLVPSLRFVVIGLLLVLVVRFRPAGLLGNPNEIVTAGEGEES